MGGVCPRATLREYASSRGELELALFHFFLAGDAVAGPRHGFETFLREFFVAGGAFAKALFANARERIVHELKQGPVIVSLAEEKFFGVGVSGLVGEIHGGIFVGFPALLLRASNAAHQLIAAREEFLFVVFEAFLIHSPIQKGRTNTSPKTFDCRDNTNRCQTSTVTVSGELRKSKRYGGTASDE
jgi:hypothetical protein